MSKKLVSCLVLTIVTCLLTTSNIELVKCVDPPETEWTRTYGGVDDEVAYSLIQTRDGGYALAGRTGSFGAGDFDFWLVKTDADGNVEWNRTYGGIDTEEARSVVSVVQTSDEGYAIAGTTRSFGAGGIDAWLVKTDADGVMEWSQTYGGTLGDHAFSLTMTSDGGYALGGETYSFAVGDVDAWLVKTDADGVMEWHKSYGGASYDRSETVIQMSDGGYALVGRTNSFGAGDMDFWLIKTDASGNKQWDKTYGAGNRDVGWSAVLTSDGGLAMAGETHSYGAGNADFWLIKVDAAGNVQWDATYGGADDEVAYSVVQTNDGEYAMAGYTESFGAGSADVYVIKVDSNGAMEWDKTFGGPEDDSAEGEVIETNDRGYATAGWTESFGAGSYDAWLIKLAGPPVGGVWVTIDTTELLAPWIGLASLTIVATASIVYVKRRKKE